MNRRDFVKDTLASLGFLALPGGLFAAPKGWKPKKRPNLTFGVVSDTHMRCHYDGVSFYERYDVRFDDQALVLVMKLFKKEGVDAILHCGDITDGGMVREMEFYKEAWDKVYGNGPRPVNLMATGNHDVAESYHWAQCISNSKDPAVYKKIRLGPHNIKQEMERIWGEPYDDIWHKVVKGYHFFGFGWPMWSEDGADIKEFRPYKGWLYRDTPDEGRGGIPYHHSTFHLAELVRREREARRLDLKKPFFVATHAFYAKHFRLGHYAIRRALGLTPEQFCNGLGFHGHGHGSDAYWRFNWGGDAPFPHVMCSTLAYWKAHGNEGDTPLFAKGFGDGTATGNMDEHMSNHALLVRVYDDMVRISRIWVNVRPKHAIGSLGEDWVMPLKGFAPNDHPLKAENYAKVIGSPEFPRRAKLVVSTGLTRFRPHQNPDNPVKKDSAPPCPCVKIRIPKADGNPDTRVYGYQIEITGSDRNASLKKNCYARGYNMGMGHEPEGGVTTLEIPKSELPKGRRLTISVTPCSSLGTKGKPISAMFNA